MYGTDTELPPNPIKAVLDWKKVPYSVNTLLFAFPTKSLVYKFLNSYNIACDFKKKVQIRLCI